MTCRSSPLPGAGGSPPRLRRQRQLAEHRGVRGELVAALGRCLREHAVDPPRARERRQRWVGARRAAVAATVGVLPTVAVGRSERLLPVRSEAAGVVRRYSLTLVGAAGEPAGRAGALAEIMGSARAEGTTAFAVLPELQLAPGLAGRGGAATWLGPVGEGRALLLPELPAADRAYSAACNAMLVSGGTLLGLLLAEVGAVVGWLRRERAYRVAVLAGEAEAGLVALLAGAVLPGIVGCLVSRLPADPLWPATTTMVLPGARRTMGAAVLAALLPRGPMLLVEGAGDQSARPAPRAGAASRRRSPIYCRGAVPSGHHAQATLPRRPRWHARTDASLRLD